MSNEEKYKLALFGVIRNNTVLPAGMKLGKSMTEINAMSVATMEECLKAWDYERLKIAFEEGKQVTE